MKNGKIKLAMVLIFLSGMVVGAVGGLVTLRVIHKKWMGMAPEQKVQVVVRRLGRRLDLREEQRPEVRAGVQRGLLKMGILQRSAGQQFFKILQETADDIEPVLDAEQRAELADMLEALREHARKQSPLVSGLRGTNDASRR
jgi:hypothetical protein